MLKPDRVLKVAFAVAKVATHAGYGALWGAVTGVQSLHTDLVKVGVNAKLQIASSEELAVLGIKRGEALCLALTYTISGENGLAKSELGKAAEAYQNIGRLLQVMAEDPH